MLLWLTPAFQSSEPEFDPGFVGIFFKPPVFFFSCATFFFGEEHPQVATCIYFKFGTDENKFLMRAYCFA